VREITFSDTPLGPMKLDAYGNPIENVYVRTVEATPAQYQGTAKVWNVPAETYKNVSQFWTYNPHKFLQQPDYSPTFQGISN
jgi:branched-chain amino acid transport system substrate-binding protein